MAELIQYERLKEMNRLTLSMALILVPLLLTGCTLTVKGLDFENLAYEIGKTRFDCNSPLMEKRMVLLQGEVNFSMSKMVCESLIYLNEQNPNKRITLLINSRGGCGDVIPAIVSMIKSIEAPVDTVNIGWCFSAAVPIFQSATGKRYAYKDSLFLLHKLKGSNKQILAKMTESYTEMIREKTNLPKKWFPLGDKPVVFDAEEALEYEFVDEIIEKIALTGGKTAG